MLRLVFVSICCLALMEAAPPVKVVNQDHYDQRQNGTENYRVNIDGVMVAVAPAEVLLSSAVDFEDLLGMLDYTDQSVDSINSIGENEPNATSTAKPPTQKPSTLKKFGFRRRLANFILPILRRNRQQ